MTDNESRQVPRWHCLVAKFCGSTLPAVLFVLLLSVSAEKSGAAPHTNWQIDTTIDTRKINSDLVGTAPTVDVAIYYPSNLDSQFKEAVPLAGVIEEFREAKRIFGGVGVQLKLLWVKSGPVDPKYFSLLASSSTDDLPNDGYSNMYIEASRNPTVLTDEGIEAFESTVERSSRNSDTIYLVVLQGVYSSYYETLDNGRNWAPRLVRTRALSFPSYTYGTEIPTRLRGVITLTGHDNENYRMIAHELGHKLMNVSHEYKEQGPQHEILGEGGLMLYGAGTDIPSGKEGRWHKERLHLSPYVYRYSKEGVRIQNADYGEQGFYYDSLYGDKVVHFEGIRLTGPKEEQ